jgi:hypothetical protein
MASASGDGETRVRFNLWVVLGFIVALFAAVAGYINTEQCVIRDRQQVVIQRVTRLETQYGFIISSIERLTEVMEKASDKLDGYRKEVKDKKTSIHDLQWK